MSNFENSPCRLIANLLIFSRDKVLLMFHRMHFAIENVTNRIFFGLAKGEMSCKKADAKATRNQCLKRRKVRTYMQLTIFSTK